MCGRATTSACAWKAGVSVNLFLAVVTAVGIAFVVAIVAVVAVVVAVVGVVVVAAIAVVVVVSWGIMMLSSLLLLV